MGIAAVTGPTLRIHTRAEPQPGFLLLGLRNYIRLDRAIEDSDLSSRYNARYSFGYRSNGVIILGSSNKIERIERMK